ncbi:MAG: hypothetical protein JKX88_04125 [Marinicaulis sp.]|nr:hypothetical protein [Marinicaulis sp.]
MAALNELGKRLRPGQVYRRADLARWSNAVDRHLAELVEDGRLVKVSSGLYMTPRKTRFGDAPADPHKLVSGFLKDNRFLLVSPNAYNGLGVGMTQLYNEMIVYNGKRYGRFELDGRVYDFRRKPFFPKSVSPEFLLVDLLNNIRRLAENREDILQRAKKRAAEMNLLTLKNALDKYGGAFAKRELGPLVDGPGQLDLAA